MPSLKQSDIATELGKKTYTAYTTAEGVAVKTQFNTKGEFVQKLATALNKGWTCAPPSTPTTMETEVTREFSLDTDLPYLTGIGASLVKCIAIAIDNETSDWADSWSSETGTHTYVVSASNIVTGIKGCTKLATEDPEAEPPVPPFWSNGAKAVAEAVADAFMSGFGQETG